MSNKLTAWDWAFEILISVVIGLAVIAVVVMIISERGIPQ